MPSGRAADRSPAKASDRSDNLSAIDAADRAFLVPVAEFGLWQPEVEMQILLFCIGAIAIFLWGVGHLIPTRNVVSGFGQLSDDNKQIITMEWLMEGLTLCFLGLLVLLPVLLLGADHAATHLVARMSAAMLFVMAAVSSVTGARTAILPMKLCPFVKGTVGVLYVVASLG